ncbi:MAG TPA: ammonium transporter [Vicinamibacterales bacterium]|jgi:Amt family ammonium transporter|nr:ammonium transporter [Vicinamibacterales bacterium]
MRRTIPLALLIVASVLALVVPPAPPLVKGAPPVAGDVAWMMTAAGLVLLMTPGLSFFYGGMVQKKNVISTMLQSMMAMVVISIVWVVVGFSLAFGDDVGGVIGNPATFFMFRHVGTATNPALAPTIPLVLFALFHLKFAIITPALITGSFAERVRFWAVVTFTVLFSLVIYCPLAHATWHPDGFLHRWGVLDFAGGTVVHTSAGMAALAGALVLGRRKLHELGGEHVPANIPFVILGTGMLWFGWFGFNAGSALAASEQAALAFATTNTASAAAALAWIAFDLLRGRKASALGACIGAVVGLVAITPAAGYVSVAQSLVIGTVSSVISNVAVHWKSRSSVDDTLDVFPCHGVGGMVGMVLTGVFAADVGLIHGHTHVFVIQLVALGIAAPFAFFGSWLLYRVTDAFIPLRVSERQELMGLDLTQHDETVSSRGVRAALEAIQGELFRDS